MVFFAVGRNGRGFVRALWDRMAGAVWKQSTFATWLKKFSASISSCSNSLQYFLSCIRLWEKTGYHSAERLSAKSFIKHGAGSQCRFVLLQFLTLTVVCGNWILVVRDKGLPAQLIGREHKLASGPCLQCCIVVMLAQLTMQIAPSGKRRFCVGYCISEGWR